MAVEVVELEQEAFDVQGVAGGEVAWAQPRGGAGLKPDDQIASAAVEAPALFLLSAGQEAFLQGRVPAVFHQNRTRPRVGCEDPGHGSPDRLEDAVVAV